MTENEQNDAIEPTSDPQDSSTATEETEVALETAETAEDEVTFVEEPTFEVDYKGECAYEVKVSIPPANRKDQAEKMYEELRHEALVPGFRPGKAPRKLIERKFAKIVRGEVDGKLVNAAFEKLIKDKDLHPIAPPDIDGIDEKGIPEGEPIALTFKFEVAPRVELGKYRGIEVERPVVTINDEDVAEQIEQLRNRMAVYETVSEEEARADDQVIIDFKGTIDGEEFPGGSAENYPYILGTNRFFSEFEKALEGIRVGKEVTCEVTFPDTYPNQDVRGKTAQFTIKANEIKRRKAPELNDEFAKLAGYESVDDMREKIRENMRAGSALQSDQIARSRAVDAVVESSSFEIPKRLIESISARMYQETVQRLLSQRVPMSVIQERDAELRTEAEQSAVREIKRMVVLNEIIDAEGLEATDEDFEREAESLAAQTGLQQELVAQYLQETEERSGYESRILRNKAMQVIMDNAVVTDKELPREELEAEAHEHHDHDHDHDHHNH